MAPAFRSSVAGIPLIDLKHLDGQERDKVVEAIGSACETYGFFMVTNHGIPEAVLEGMVRMAREFFHLPESERMKCCYSDDPKKAIRLSTSFNVRTEKVSNWRDFLRLHCYPLESFINQWPSNPPAFRQAVGTYSTEARALALWLLEAISESPGLERGHMVKAMGRQAQHMAVNYYPPCPQPELTYGLPGHKDPNAITLLLQDGVSGLQVQRDGRWVAVNPVPNALVINIGDQIQALSNDRYKSVLHRVIVNSESERISVQTFYCPSPDTVVAPAVTIIRDPVRVEMDRSELTEHQMDSVSIQMPAANPDTAAEQMVDAARDETELQCALVCGGTAQASAALLVACFRTPGGVFLRDRLLFHAYYVVLAAVAIFGAMEVAVGFWVAGDPRRRRGKGKLVMSASVVPQVLVTALGGFAVPK